MSEVLDKGHYLEELLGAVRSLNDFYERSDRGEVITDEEEDALSLQVGEKAQKAREMGATEMDIWEMHLAGELTAQSRQGYFDAMILDMPLGLDDMVALRDKFGLVG